MEILYSLRLGSELDCKYGPDLEIKHFKSKKKSMGKIQGKRNKKRTQSNRSPTGFPGVKFRNIVN